MALFTNPTSFQNANALYSPSASHINPFAANFTHQEPTSLSQDGHFQTTASGPSLPRLALLVFEAVLEVVCVSFPGYLAARQGMFDTEAQKFVANLNVTLFTPCLSELHESLFRHQYVTSKAMSLISLYHFSNSFYETSFTADGEEVDGPGNYSCYLPRPDRRILHMLDCNITMF